MSFKVLSKKPITIHEAKEILEKASGEGAEADQLLLRTLDYLSKFSKISAEAARRAVERLVSELGLSEEEAVEVVNILPGSVEELRAITNGWHKLLTTESLQKILQILEEARAGGSKT